MAANTLSPEIVSLIHHVELNKSGWWRKAIGQVIKGVLWQGRTPMTMGQIQAALRSQLGMQLSQDVLSKQLDVLIGQAAISPLSGSVYKLSEQTKNELSQANEMATKEQVACKEQFDAACQEYCPELSGEELWHEFTGALQAAIRLAGANLFHLLADGNLERETDWLAALLKHFPAESYIGIKKVLASFFAPDNQSCRNQVLRLLSAHFFAEASQLTQETIACLESDSKTKSIKVVLDTNFIFSILGLHDNPGDDAAHSLVELAKKSGRFLDVKLYVLPGTLDEAKRVLSGQVHLIERIRATPKMASAALSQPLPSIAKKFLDAATKVSGLTAESFFVPYIQDLRTILDGKGIKVLDAQPEVYHKRQDVVDDVLAELRVQEAEVPESRRKSYESLVHDAALWHAVNDRRRAEVDSPLEIEYWAVSIDWRLIGFDRRKRAAKETRLPVVLHPNNLVQLVQFWLPRSPELDSSLVDSLSLPLFFQSFDPEDEKAAIKVLEAISRFENIDDLPESTLKIVLANQALRQRIKDGVAANDQIFEMVREELLSEHRKAIAELESTRSSLRDVEVSRNEEREGRRLKEVELGTTVRDLNEAKEKLASAQAKIAEHTELRNSISRRSLRINFMLLFVALPGVMGLVGGYFFVTKFLVNLPRFSHGLALGVSVAAVGLLPFALGCVLSPYYTKDKEYLMSWSAVRVIHAIGRRAVLAPVGLAITGAFQGGVWDWLKSLMGWNQ